MADDGAGGLVGIAALGLALFGVGAGYLGWQDFTAKSQHAETTLAGLQAQVETAVSKADLDALVAKVDAMDGSIAAIKGEIDTLKTSIPAAQPELPAQVTQVSQDLVALTKVVNAHIDASVSAAPTAEVEALSTQLTSQAQALAALQTDVEALKKSGADSTTTADLAKVSSDLAELAQRLQAHLDLPPVTTPPAEPAGAVALLRTEILTLLENVPDRAALNAVAARDEKAVADLTAQMAEVEQALSGTRGAIDDIRATVAELAKAQSGAQSGADGRFAAITADLDALERLVGEHSSSLEAAIKAVSERLDKEVARLDAKPVPQPVDTTAADAKIADQLATTTLALGEIRSKLAELDAAVKGAATVAALDEVREKIAKGGGGGKTELVQQVYFDVSSAKLSDDELLKMDALADQLRTAPRDLAIVGFTDTTGQPEYNRALSLRRATAVRKALIERGTEASIVTSIDGVGEDGPPVLTDDGSSEPRNRTVMIYAYY